MNPRAFLSRVTSIRFVMALVGSSLTTVVVSAPLAIQASRAQDSASEAAGPETIELEADVTDTMPSEQAEEPTDPVTTEPTTPPPSTQSTAVPSEPESTSPSAGAGDVGHPDPLPVPTTSGPTPATPPPTTTPPTSAPAPVLHLTVSDNPDRSGGRLLDDAFLSGLVYIYYSPTTTVDTVEFWIDDTTGAGPSPDRRQQPVRPGGQRQPGNGSTVRHDDYYTPGPHWIYVEVTGTAGVGETELAKFEVTS